MTDSAREGGSTPGPWEVQYDGDGVPEGIVVKDSCIVVFGFDDWDGDNPRGNAELAASAPQLRDLLRECQDRILDLEIRLAGGHHPNESKYKWATEMISRAQTELGEMHGKIVEALGDE